MDFLCLLCIISNKKFKNQIKVVVANKKLEDAETTHSSLSSSKTSPTTANVMTAPIATANTSVLAAVC